MSESDEGGSPGAGEALAATDASRLGASVVSTLRAAGWTVAVAESLTAGSVCAVLTQHPGASEAVRGAVVAYAVDVKASVLHVDAEELARTGPVTARVALAMALGVREVLQADVGLATTGEAGPDSASGQPVGTVFVAVVTPDGSWSRELAIDGGRDEIRAESVAAVLALAEEALSPRP